MRTVNTFREIIEFVQAQDQLYHAPRYPVDKLVPALHHCMHRCYEHLNPYDRLEQYTANEKFSSGLEVARADGVEVDSISALYGSHIDKSFENSVAVSMIVAARLIWHESGGSLESLPYEVKLPYAMRNGRPDDLFDLELDALAEAFDQEVGLSMRSMTDVQSQRSWLLARLREDSHVIAPIPYALVSLQTLFSLVENIGIVFRLNELVTYRLLYDVGRASK